MGKKSLWERIFGGSHSPKGLTRRGLKVENLEDRQLLSAVGWEVTPAYTTDLALETSTVKASLTLEEADTVPDQIRVQIFLNGTAFQEFADGKYATTTDAEAVVGDGGLDGDTTTTDYYEFTVDNPGTWAVGENDVIIQDLFGADVNLSQVGFTVLAKDEIPDTVTSPVHFHVKAQAIVWDPASETEIDITPAGVENIALTQLPAPEILDQYVSGSSSNIMIQWSPVTDAAGYEYRYKLNTEGETEWSAPISSGSVEGEPNTYAMVNSLTANTKYDFQLRSVGDAAHETSEWSALKSYTTRPLATPTITVNSRTADDINISWVTDPNAASYTVTAILPDGITYGTNTNATQTDGSFSLKGNLFNAEGNDFVLTPGTTYSIQLSAVPAVPSEYLSSGSSDEATTKTPLAVPTNLGSTAHTDTTVTLSWEAVTNAASYTVSAWDGIEGSEVLYQNFTTVSGDFTGLNGGTTYTFKVMAVADPTSEYVDSEYSEGINVTTKTPLAAPVIDATATSAVDSITITWGTVESAVSYSYRYKSNSSEEWGEAVSVGTNLTATIGTLASNTQYDFQVKAIADASTESADSAWSTAASFYTLSVAPTLAQPTLDGTTLTLTWDTAEGNVVNGYNAYVNVGETEFVKINQDGPLSVSTTTYTIEAGKLYDFKVVSLNGAGAESAGSNVYTVEKFSTPQIDAITPAYDSVNGKDTLKVDWSRTTLEFGSSYLVQWKVADPEVTDWNEITAAEDVFTYTVSDGLLANTEYVFRVTAIPQTPFADNTVAFASDAATDSAYTLAVAPIITGDGELSTNESVTVTWVMPLGANTEGVKYNVYKGLIQGGVFELVNDVPVDGTNLLVSGLNQATDYWFKVASVNPDGFESAPSETYMLTTMYNDPAGTVAPTTDTPWDLTFTMTSTLVGDGTWRVWRTADSEYNPNTDEASENFKEVINGQTTSPFTWTEENAEAIRAGGYYYWVQTFETRGVGEDAYVVSSNYVSMNADAVTVIPKDLALAAITVEDQTTTTAVFSFEPVDVTDTTNEVAGYVVTLYGAPGSEFTPITYTIMAGDTNYWDVDDECYYVEFTGLTAGTVYAFDVDAHTQFVATETESIPAEDLAYDSSTATAYVYTDLAAPVVAQVTGTEKARSFTFNWTQTPDNGTTGYKAEVFKGTDETGQVFWIGDYALAGKPESITITESNQGTAVVKVEPETAYFVKVTAYAEDVDFADAFGTVGITTNALTALTTPVIANGSPTATINSFTAVWDASAPESDVATYTFTYWTDEANKTSVPGLTETTYTVTGCPEGTAYSFTIQAFAVADGEYTDSAVSDVYTVTTLKSIPGPQEGEDVIVEDETPNSLLVEWDPVDEENQDLVSGYTIEILNPAGDVVEEIFVPGAASDQVEVDGLASGTDYTFNVYANPSEQGEADGYGETLLGTGSGKTAYADPVWDLADYNFATYVLSADPMGEETVATLTGYGKNSKEGVNLGSFNVKPGNTPVIIGAQNAKENFMIADSAREYFGNINVLGGGVKNFYVRRDTLVVSGSEGADVVTVNHVSGTGTILDDRDVLGSGAIQIETASESGLLVPTANVTFSGMNKVLVNTEAGNDTFKVNEMTAYYTWLVARPGEGVEDIDTLDFSNAATINDRTDVTGAIVNLNATYQMVAGQNGRLKLAAGDQAVEKIIGSKAIDTIISGKQGIEFFDESESRNIINLTRSETSNNVEVTGDHQTILGGKGDDTITVTGNYCTINMAQDGANSVRVTGDHNTIIGGDGNDAVAVYGSRNVINTLGGDDIVTLYDNCDVLADGNIVHLGNGNDILLASLAKGSANKNFFYGEGGDDIIIGSDGNDYIYGGGGSNFLIGMRGKDYIYGGSGNDILAGNDFQKLADSLYGDEGYNVAGLSALVANILAAAQAEDYEGIFDLTGAATEDGEKDFMYRGGGYNHLFFQSLALGDNDFVNPLTTGKNRDWVITDDID